MGIDNKNCLIFLLTCNCCQKQYVGQTKAYLGTDGTITKIMLETFFLHDVSITLIDKTYLSCRTKREYH